jgi:hypothetical protein
MNRRARLLLIVLAVMMASITAAFATPPPPPPPTGQSIGPFTTLADCNDSLKNSTVPHSGCYQCGWIPDRFCYNVYPAGQPSDPSDPGM